MFDFHYQYAKKINNSKSNLHHIIKLVKKLLMSNRHIIKGRRQATRMTLAMIKFEWKSQMQQKKLLSGYYLNLIITVLMSCMSIVSCMSTRLEETLWQMILIRLLVKVKGRQNIRIFQSVLTTIIRQTSGASAADVAGIRSSGGGGCQTRQMYWEAELKSGGFWTHLLITRMSVCNPASWRVSEVHGFN